MPWGFQASCGLRPHLSLERRSAYSVVCLGATGFPGGGALMAERKKVNAFVDTTLKETLSRLSLLIYTL